MKNPTIPYCGRKTYSASSEDCRECPYGGKTDNYCNYWDIHSPNDCPTCNGSGYSSEGGQCEDCYGSGEIQ
jgi:DnaJ-class molecular chaperone